jgi:hypothetical protein
MKKNNWILSITVFALAACNTSSNLYQAEKTKGVDFKNYKTYAWLATKDTAYTKLVNKKNLERALAAEVIQQLGERGMVLDTLNPDCLFTYTLVMNKTYEVGQQPNEVYNTQVYAPAYSGQNNIYYYRPDYGPSTYSGHISVATFRDGSLVIDMIDQKKNEVIWRASAQAKKSEADLKGVKVKEIVPEMFKKFPKPKVKG